ncbi:MAG: hypothetical protein FWH15_05305 [Betaproteobacteria bacterium]|nr:hypothetical protein [Betaproteobacteria bacterium]
MRPGRPRSNLLVIPAKARIQYGIGNNDMLPEQDRSNIPMRTLHRNGKAFLDSRLRGNDY